MRRNFDAIIVGAGASGGLAAALLCESGLSVLLLDAGRESSFWKKPLSKILSTSIGAISDPRLAGVLHPRLINAGTRPVAQCRTPSPTGTEGMFRLGTKARVFCRRPGPPL